HVRSRLEEAATLRGVRLVRREGGRAPRRRHRRRLRVPPRLRVLSRLLRALQGTPRRARPEGRRRAEGAAGRLAPDVAALTPERLLARFASSPLADVARRVIGAERLSFEDGVALFRSRDLLGVGALANLVRER